MNTEEIKVGETYYVRVKVTATSENRFVCRPLLWGCTLSNFAPNYFNFAEAEAFYNSIPETTPPKHDPCRLFKKGDKVRIRKVNGNLPKCRYNGVTVKDGTIGEINSSDERNCYWVKFNRTTSWCFDCAYFELVTPVEELMPYHVQKAAEFDAWFVCNRNNDVIFHFNPDPSNQNLNIEEAEKLARAECDYLNERFRDLIGKVTPVEELEPYYLEEQDSCYVVGKRQEDPETEYIAGFSKTRHPSAKAAAEAECKRLNEEWRKEQNNDRS